MSIKSDIVKIGEQEKALRFERFDLGAAWSVGQHIRSAAAAAGHVLSVDIQINGMQAFFAAMRAPSRTSNTGSAASAILR